MQIALDKGTEAYMFNLDFGAAFDHINHNALIYKLRNFGIGGSLINVLSEFLLIRTRGSVLMASLVVSENVILGVPQGSVFGSLLYYIYL